MSYNFTPLRQAKISYSRRVSRPNPFQLSPIENAKTRATSFAEIRSCAPEYTDALELGYQESRSVGFDPGEPVPPPYVACGAQHPVRRLHRRSVSTFDNVASTITVGTDLNVNARHGPLQLGGGGSVYHYSSDASNLSGNLSASAAVWSARTNATWKFSPRADAQVFGSIARRLPPRADRRSRRCR